MPDIFSSQWHDRDGDGTGKELKKTGFGRFIGWDARFLTQMEPSLLTREGAEAKGLVAEPIAIPKNELKKLQGRPCPGPVITVTCR